MFHSARLKLTGWYLLIIMLISLAFSGAIYTVISRELERGFRRAEVHFRFGDDFVFPPPPFDSSGQMNTFLIEELATARHHLVFNLLLANGAILIFSGAAGYFLAGRTLKPIETALEEQRRFVADASHELRTPLTALRTSIEVGLREKKITDNEARSVLKGSLEDISDLESLANGLLCLSRYQQNGVNLVSQPVDIKKVVDNAVRKIIPLAKKKKINLKLEVDSLVFFADASSLEEMLLIFLDNAVKYTPTGGQVAVETKTNKNSLTIEIRDTGMGIAETEIPHIFDRFYRADQSRSKENVPGFGLGLSLAKKIIEIHQGSAKVDSKLGQGTTFTIKLPLN